MVYLNLLPESHARHQLIRRRLVQWALVWMVLLAAGVYLGWSQLHGYRARIDRLAELTLQAEPLQQMQQDTSEMQQRLEELKGREQLVLSLTEDRSMLVLIGVVSRATVDAKAEVSVTRMVVTQPQPARTEAGGTPAASHGSLLLEGTGLTDIAVSQFVRSLRDSGMFHDVRLTSTGSQTIGEHTARNYSVTCSF